MRRGVAFGQARRGCRSAAPSSGSGPPTLDAVAGDLILQWEPRQGSPTAVTLVGSRVSQVLDLSGNGNHTAVNGNDALRPAWSATGGVRGQPVINLARVTDTLVCTLVRAAGSRYSFYAVGRLSCSGGAKFPARSGSLFHFRCQEAGYSYSGLDSEGVQHGDHATAPRADTFMHLVEEIYAATGWTMQVDGIDYEPPFETSDAAGAMASVEVGLGGSSASAGDLALLLIFAVAHDATQRAVVREYIDYHYGGVSTRGSWSWFEGPRAVRYAAGGVDRTFIGVVDDRGNVAVLQRDHLTGVTTRGTLATGFEVDDHDSPALLVRSSDNRLIASWCAHVASDEFWVAISTNPLDASSWGAPVNLHAVLGDQQYTYAYEIELSDGIYNFYRGAKVGFVGVISDWFYTKSTDQGVTWSARQQFFTAVTDPVHGRPYLHFHKMSNTRIDVFVCEDHPAEAPDGECSLYHCYWEGGSYYQTDGTLIGSSAPTPQDCTLVWDGSGGEPGWNWQISDDGAGNPTVVFATFPGYPTVTDHRYRYGRWNGSAWQTWEIVAAGTHLPFSGHAAPHYSGGIEFDGPDAVLCSRETGGVWDLYRYVTEDGGATWTLDEQITTGPASAATGARVNMRPVVPLGGGHAEMPYVWMTGTYRGYGVNEFATRIRTVDATILADVVALES